MRKNYKYLIGADPELFLVNTKGEFRSAHNVIPGDKRQPFEVLSGAIQPDGVAAEFNIHPAATAEEFRNNIKDVLLELSSRISTSHPDLSLIVSPTATFDKAYFRRLPKKAKLLGCEADYNAYTGTVNPPPSTREPFRTGAGHIHIGWTEGETSTEDAHMYDCHQAVFQLDSVLYPMSLLWDDDDKRRTLYGKIGAFRPKHYGVEYRPLSNAWVADPDLQTWLFNTAKQAMHDLDNGMSYFKDYFAQNILKQIKSDLLPDRLTLLEYHDYLVDYCGLPKMPEAYIRTYQ